MVFGMEGKSGGVLVRVKLETSGPPTGVAARFPCPADPSTPAAGRGAGPSDSSGSSKRKSELWDDSTIKTSAGLSLAVSTVCRAVHCGRAVTCVPGRPLWPGRHLWPSRPLWPGRCLWPSRHLWSGRCLWPCRCVLPGRHPWPSRRLLPGRHLRSCPLPVPGLELLGPIQHESAGRARTPSWSYAS